MISEHSRSVAEKAKRIYADQLRSELEAKHRDRFVAIEPESGNHFVADSFSQAVAAARREYPGRISFVIRVGHDAALHIGGISNGTDASTNHCVPPDRCIDWNHAIHSAD